MQRSCYEIKSPKITRPQRILVLSDFHNRPYRSLLRAMRKTRPELILIAGDLVDRHRRTYRRVLPFLLACTELAPTVFSYGNHEVKYPVLSREQLEATGVRVLDNAYFRTGDLVIGGQTPYADTDWLDAFEREDGYRILLCHHPEYYDKQDLKHRKTDLILAGHAHGGQIRVGDRGLFAPGQGLMAKYVHGIYGNMIVSAGLSNTARPIPRIGNPEELVVLDLQPAETEVIRRNRTARS